METSFDPIEDDPGVVTDLVMDTSTSKIVTLEPFSSPVLGNPQKRLKLKERTNEKVNKSGRMQILPGIFELVSYNKFLLLQFENLIGNINPFKAYKEIACLCGREPKIRSQGDGSLLIEASSPEESEKLMKMTKLVGNDVKCLPHPIFNQCRGVIYAPELLSIDADEIQTELEDQNVIKVVRMMKNVKDRVIPLPTLILTFKTYRMPSTIKAGWLNFKVKPYIPSPLRCYHCHMFGHSSQKCKKRINQEPSICVNCGKNTHGDCEETPKCINCGDVHPASSRNCPRFLYEKEVQAIRVVEKVSFKEARKKALEKQFRPGETFSSVIRRVKIAMPKENQLLEQGSRQDIDIPAPQQEDPEPPITPVPQQKDRKPPNKLIPQRVDLNPPNKPTPRQVDPNPPNNPISENAVISVASGKKDASNKQLRSKNVAQALPHPKATPSTSGVQSNCCTPYRRQEGKKRERTPEENSNQGVTDDDPLSQASAVIPRNAVKLKRLGKK